jgi:hypothetical protein
MERNLADAERIARLEMLAIMLEADCASLEEELAKAERLIALWKQMLTAEDKTRPLTTP